MSASPIPPVLTGKTILVVGLGRSGLAAALLARHRGGRVVVTDSRPFAALADAAAALPAEVAREFGGHQEATFVAADLIVVSPGVPDQPALQAARAAGVTVVGELEFASRFIAAPLVAITGTNGKSTTTTLCGAMCGASGRPTFVGGNLGIPLCEAVTTEAATAAGICVVEVSSFQLETIDRFRARVAVVLNVTADHLDRYRSLADYAGAKGRLLQTQTSDDFAVINQDDPWVQRLAEKGRGRVVPFSTRHVLREGGWLHDQTLCLRLPGGDLEHYPADLPGLIGRHNQENALAAALAARLMGVPAATVRSSLLAFRPLAHRMELVAEVGEVSYYDDSKGTNVGAVVAALSGFPRPVVLIAGGRDKGGSYETLAAALQGKARGAVLIGEAATRMAAALEAAVPTEVAVSLEVAVQRAALLARPGDAVVLSPACSSFDMFRNYEHRAQVFRAAVLALAPTKERS